MNDQTATPLTTLLIKGFKNNTTASIFSIYTSIFIMFQVYCYGKLTMIPVSFQFTCIVIFAVIHCIALIVVMGSEVEKKEAINNEENEENEEKHFEELNKEFGE